MILKRKLVNLKASVCLLSQIVWFPMFSVQKTELVKDPTVSCFEPQPATVTCLEFSTYCPDIFATSSMDQAIRIYSLYQVIVLKVTSLYQLTCLAVMASAAYAL